MEKKSEERIELHMHDNFDRAEACSADSDDYSVYERQGCDFAKILVEHEKIVREYDLELKRIELERMKIRKELDWKDPRFLLSIVVVPIIGIVVPRIMDRHTLREHRTDTMAFEESGHAFTSMAGRANSSGFKLFRF